MPGQHELYPVGTWVRIASRNDLQTFAATWRFHHKLQPDQIVYAERVAPVHKVSVYHGGDVLYEFKEIPGIWHEACLRSAAAANPSDQVGERPAGLRLAIVVAAFCSFASAVYVLTGADPAPVVAAFMYFGPFVTVAWWLRRDAERIGIGAVQDLGFFLWIAWPFVIPWYAFRSRGARGWKLLVGATALILSAYITAYAVAWAVYLVRWLAWRWSTG
jgi:hypothetical protein